MTWSEISPMDQRTQFIADYLRGLLCITELCELYGVSRKTGYKWIDRYIRHGPAGLEEGSRRPEHSPNETASEIITAIIEARHRHPTWGAKKLLTLLHKRYPRWHLPGRSTVCDILSRNGLVPKKPRRRHIGHPGKPSTQILAPNDVWCADFKGQFKTGMVCTATHSLSLTVSAAICLAARPCVPPLWQGRNRCLPPCSKSMGCRAASAPITACLLPPRHWLGYRVCRPGGCALACCRS